MDQFCVYILYSESHKVHYVGFTSNLILRIRQHNYSDFDKKAYTYKYRPWIVIHVEHFELKANAMKREKWLKTGVGRDWIKNNILFP